MRTEAERMEFNMVRLDAEMYRLQMDAKLQMQQQEFVQIMVIVMHHTQQFLPHVTYIIYNNTYKPPLPPPATAVAIDLNNFEFKALERE